MPNSEIHTDKLVALIREGKKEGFDYLYRKYSGPIYGIILKTVEEQAQAQILLEVTFVHIYRDIDQYSCATTFFVWMVRKAREACCARCTPKAKPAADNLAAMMLVGGYSCERLAGELNMPQTMVQAELRNSLKMIRQTA